MPSTVSIERITPIVKHDTVYILCNNIRQFIKPISLIKKLQVVSDNALQVMLSIPLGREWKRRYVRLMVRVTPIARSREVSTKLKV